MSQSSAFSLLSPGIQRYLWAEQWEALRAVQEMAIPLILSADQDVIVAASTASGKTEAAFLPALTYLEQQSPPGLIVYISPLKALINDQFGRLERLCEDLDIPVWPWHGDISSTSKQRFFKKPHGVVLITPESLEAMLCNRGTSVAGIFKHLAYFVVDELHAFIGSERGKQLQSLLHRIDTVIDRTVPRIGLSATLGDMQAAARFLRPKGEAAIVDAPSEDSELLLVVKGFEEPLPPREAEDGQKQKDKEKMAPLAVAKHLFQTLRGSNNLVFPNSRREVERYTHLLNKLCEEAAVPREFWPHHGSLSKEIRYDTEAALKQKDHPATAVCTNTLELGIDIGAVKSVAQVGTPPTVASLRQRMGRSGRRKGEPAILRGYVIEDALDSQADLQTRLRLDTIQTLAVVTLLTERWYEPPVVKGAHLSTFIQQLLSVIAQYGGIHPAQAYQLLCASQAPFDRVSKDAFMELLRHLGQQDILIQDGSGLLLHGPVGDRIVNHYSFYAAFTVDEEFRIVAAGKPLGTLPVSQMLTTGQRILFGGRTWVIDQIDEAQKTIYVSATRSGAPPLFSGGAGRVHTQVRQTMREIYRGSLTPSFVDACAQRFMDEGRASYQHYDLDNRLFLDRGSDILLLTWLGDAANEAIACLLNARDFKAQSSRLGVEIARAPIALEDIEIALKAIAAEPAPTIDALLASAKNLASQKWDHLLSPRLLQVSYASSNLDLDEAMGWLRSSFLSCT
ncbi:DEAD/DEAH box helicase [Xanthomonas sontii]|uniref:DEAD/DEAH box helicase n=1 Tax=Xanthomonas sontii TaxID=2650745 RepID=A0A6N7QPW2_9XANT|nr:DEAD/DEAH box helicase [Xanthomonas sontii]KAA8921391.1 DEAD/DEAH box helicase [Xanthomonas sontii]MRH02672.1 DEAD/DEAH box helicase [Xanthomonas sontii]MRH76986.1 DEAD/DEAH box helicase [Xanthomonas sontii]